MQPNVPFINPEDPTHGTGSLIYSPTKDNEQGLLAPKEDLSAAQQAAAGEQGQSGTLISGGGFISFEEYNKDLMGRAGLRVYDEMRKGDATVQQSLKVVKQPILAAQYNIEPASSEPEDEMIAAFIEENLFERINFQNFLREALTMLDFGFAVFEKVFDYDSWEGFTHTAEERVAQPDGTFKSNVTATHFEGGQYLMLKKLGSRRALTIMRWQTADKHAGITQMPYTGGQLSIPLDKLAVFTNDQEGDNFEGVSLLRPAYKHWFYKETLYKIQAIAMERQGVGLPQLTAPEDADEPSKAQAREALKDLRANEKGYIEIPKGYVIDFMNMQGTSVIDCSNAIDHHDRQIMKNVLAGFLELGAHKGASGSHALSADQSRLFVQYLEGIAKKVCEVINNDIIKPLVDYNFNTSHYPKLETGSLADDNVMILAESIERLTNADVLTPDPDLEQFIRDTFKLPGLPDEIKNNYNNRARSQAATVADAKDPTERDAAVSEVPDDFAEDDVTATEIVKDAAAYRNRLGKQIDALTRRS